MSQNWYQRNRVVAVNIQLMRGLEFIKTMTAIKTDRKLW
jgi:hypothetical protein